MLRTLLAVTMLLATQGHASASSATYLAQLRQVCQSVADLRLEADSVTRARLDRILESDAVCRGVALEIQMEQSNRGLQDVCTRMIAKLSDEEVPRHNRVELAKTFKSICMD